MTKQELIRATAKAAGVRKDVAAAVLTAAMGAAADALANGEAVKVNGYGTFEIRQRRAQRSYDFATRTMIQRAESKAIAFVPAADLKKRVNNGKGDA